MDSHIDRTVELLERLGNLLRREGREGALGGLAPVQWQALAYLGRCNRFSDHPAAVAEYLGLTRGTVSQTLKVLEREGLVRKEADASDGRRVHLRLTAGGRRLLERGYPPPGFAQALEAMGPDAERLESLLDTLLREAVRQRGGRAFGVCRECRHFTRTAQGYRCALLDQPLTEKDADRICVEQEAAAG